MFSSSLIERKLERKSSDLLQICSPQIPEILTVTTVERLDLIEALTILNNITFLQALVGEDPKSKMKLGPQAY